MVQAVWPWCMVGGRLLACIMVNSGCMAVVYG